MIKPFKGALASVGWAPHVMALELRKAFAYRAEFWIRFVVGSSTALVVAYFLWGAIFASSGQATLQGYSFHGILFYCVFAALGSRIVTGGDGQGAISQEIYDGTLTRSLIYRFRFFLLNTRFI